MTGKPTLRAILLILALSSASCRSGGGNAAPAEGPPHPRIVSLIPSATSIVYSIGAGKNLAGVTRYCRTQDGARPIPRVGGILDVSLEAVAATRPDVVIGSPSVLKGRFRDILGDAGVRFLPLDFENLDDVRNGIVKIGEATGHGREASDLLADFNRSLNALRGYGRGVRVLFVVGTKPLVVASSSSFQGQLLEAMGFRNVVESSRSGFPTWSLEQVIKSAPEVIIDGIVGGEPSASLLSEAGITAPVVRIPDESILLPCPDAVSAAARLGDVVLAAIGKEGGNP